MQGKLAREGASLDADGVLKASAAMLVYIPGVRDMLAIRSGLCRLRFDEDARAFIGCEGFGAGNKQDQPVHPLPGTERPRQSAAHQPVQCVRADPAEMPALGIEHTVAGGSGVFGTMFVRHGVAFRAKKKPHCSPAAFCQCAECAGLRRCGN